MEKRSKREVDTVDSHAWLFLFRLLNAVTSTPTTPRVTMKSLSYTYHQIRLFISPVSLTPWWSRSSRCPFGRRRRWTRWSPPRFWPRGPRQLNRTPSSGWWTCKVDDESSGVQGGREAINTLLKPGRILLDVLPLVGTGIAREGGWRKRQILRTSFGSAGQTTTPQPSNQ